MTTSRGEPTEYQGIYRSGPNAYVVLVTYQKNGKRAFREERIDGSISDARDRHAVLRAKLITEAAQSAVTGKASDLISAYASMWLEDPTVTMLAPASQARYDVELRQFVLPYMGKRKVSSLKKSDLKEWLSWAPKQVSTRGKVYSRNSIHGGWRVLHTFLRYVSLMTNTPNLCDGTVRFKIDERLLTPARDRPTPNRAQLHKILDALESSRRQMDTDRQWLMIRTITSICAMTGCRIGEVAGLHVNDIDMSADVVTVRRTVSGKVISPKTKTGLIRHVPLDPTSKALVQEYLKEWAPSNKHGNALFLSATGETLASRRIQKTLDRACELAGAPRMTPHAFRRTVVNGVRRSAGGQVAAMAIAGHASADMSLHYSSADMDERRASLMEAVWLPKSVGVSVGADAEVRPHAAAEGGPRIMEV